MKIEARDRLYESIVSEAVTDFPFAVAWMRETPTATGVTVNVAEKVPAGTNTEVGTVAFLVFELVRATTIPDGPA